MAAYRAKIPSKAQATLQYFRALRSQSGSAATETHNAPLRRYFRAYGTGALQRVKVCPRQDTRLDTRLYGRCAFLLGGGIGLYSALKLSLQQHFAEEQLSHVLGTTPRVTLYQYKTCPQCSKLRAFLDYYGLEYDIVEVNPVLHTEIKWAASSKVPILVIEGEEALQLNDASVIMSALKTCMIDKSKTIHEVINYYPVLKSKNIFGIESTEYTNRHWVMLNEIALELHYPNKNARRDEVKWRHWADDWLLCILAPNVYRSPAEALEAYEHIVLEGNYGLVEGVVIKYVGAFTMFFLSKLLQIWYRMETDVRQDLYKAADEWMTAVGKKRTFLGGDKPNLADISVYGVLRTVEGQQAFDDVMKHTRMRKWYQAMEKVIQERGGQD
ncbi:prostaglandin E synthase 2-like [Clupea harengus]|uniref:Prostaglandin E synthase 2-like n=1 Tax=Clupea harengus TaxID=7950 RepID=A0A6P3WAW8_CLUHA|nr:prostaglandin E synthase 2-like [Clupea harengus]